MRNNGRGENKCGKRDFKVLSGLKGARKLGYANQQTNHQGLMRSGTKCFICVERKVR